MAGGSVPWLGFKGVLGFRVEGLGRGGSGFTYWFLIGTEQVWYLLSLRARLSGLSQICSLASASFLFKSRRCRLGVPGLKTGVGV